MTSTSFLRRRIQFTVSIVPQWGVEGKAEAGVLPIRAGGGAAYIRQALDWGPAHSVCPYKRFIGVIQLTGAGALGPSRPV